MNSLRIHLPLLGVALALSACQPIDRGGRPDGNDLAKELRAGQFARTLIDNTAFFRELPISGGDPDLLLQRHTSVRVIQIDETFTKIELDSGAIGYVMTVLLEPVGRPAQPDRQQDDPRIKPVDPLDPADPSGRHVEPTSDPEIPGQPPLPPTIDPE